MPVLRTPAVAGKPHVTVEAVPRQRLALVPPERALPGKGDQLEHVPVLDDAEQTAKLDVGVAGVEVAVCSRTSCWPRVCAWIHMLLGSPYQLASVEPNICA